MTALQKELEEVKDKYEKVREKKKSIKVVKEDLDDQLRAILDVRSQMQNKLVQATVQLQDEELQCVLIASNQNSQ